MLGSPAQCEVNNLFCGHLSPKLVQILGIKPLHNVRSWFGDCSVYYVHMARVAIRYACQLLGIGKGCEVLASSYNCGSEIDALQSSGASVVLYRVDKHAQVDLADLRRRLTDKTKAIYVTHYFGFPQPVAAIKSLAEERGIYLIEDCALSLFSRDGKVKIGTTGDISVFNFPKTLPVPDGGALLINNQDLVGESWLLRRPKASRVLRGMLPLFKREILRKSSGIKVLYPLLWAVLKRTYMSCHSNIRSVDERAEMPESYYYDEQISNMGVSAITRRMLATFAVSDVVNRRRDNFNLFLNLLSGVRRIEPLYRQLPEGICPLYFPVIVRDRDQLCEKLNKLSIAAISWWSGYHRAFSWDAYPDACFLKDNLLVLPIHQCLNREHIEFIAARLQKWIRTRAFG